MKLISEPHDKDWPSFFQVTKAHMLKAISSGQEKDDEEDLEDDADGNYASDGSAQAKATEEENTRGLDEASTDTLRWSPDRPLVNMLFDIVHGSGFDGISIQVFLSCHLCIGFAAHINHRALKTHWSGIGSTDLLSINSPVWLTSGKSLSLLIFDILP